MEDAKTYLKQLHTIKKGILIAENEIRSLRQSAAYGSIRYDRPRVDTSRSDPMTEYMVRVENSYKRLAVLTRKYTGVRVELEMRLMEFAEAEPIYAEILAMRYIDGYSWNKIADALRKETDSVIRYHGKALKLFEEMF